LKRAAVVATSKFLLTTPHGLAWLDGLGGAAVTRNIIVVSLYRTIGIIAYPLVDMRDGQN